MYDAMYDAIVQVRSVRRFSERRDRRQRAAQQRIGPYVTIRPFRRIDIEPAAAPDRAFAHPKTFALEYYHRGHLPRRLGFSEDQAH